MLKIIVQRVFIAVASLAFLNMAAASGFDAAYAASSNVVNNIENEKLPAGASFAQVEQAVLSAMASRGWQIMSRTPGAVDGQYARRGFSVTIHVTYTAEAFSIAYVESTGLNYNTEHHTIHHNYNRWINNLRVDIPLLVQNTMMGVPPTATH